MPGLWSRQEDETCRRAVYEELMDSNQLDIYQAGRLPVGFPWKRISEKVQSRSGKQCRERFINYLCTGINKSPWKVEEDQKLRELVALYGTSWIKISNLLPGRPPNQVKMRWKRLCSKRKSAPLPIKYDDSFLLDPFELSYLGDYSTHKRTKLTIEAEDAEFIVGSPVTATMPESMQIPDFLLETTNNLDYNLDDDFLEYLCTHQNINN